MYRKLASSTDRTLTAKVGSDYVRDSLLKPMIFQFSVTRFVEMKHKIRRNEASSYYAISCVTTTTRPAARIIMNDKK